MTTPRREFLEVDGRRRISWKRLRAGTDQPGQKAGETNEEQKDTGIVVVVLPSRILDPSRIPQD